MSDILVIRCNTLIHPEKFKKIRDGILADKESGVIVLPNMFEAIVVPDDTKIVFEDKED